MTSIQTKARTRRVGPWAWQVAAALVLTACDASSLLDVNTPDQITPAAAASPAGAAAIRAAAIGNFANFFAGDPSGGSPVGMNMYSGIFSDEIISSRGGTEHLDQRAQNDNLFPSTSWNVVGTASTQIIRAIKALNTYVAASASRNMQVGELYGKRGFLMAITAEIFCNGVPIANADDANPVTETLNNVDLYTRSLAQFDSALAVLSPTAAGDLTYRYMVRVGKARALMNLNKYPQAVAVLGAGGDGSGSAAIPSSFVFNVEYGTVSIVNTMYDWMVATPNFGAADKEGGNGLDFVTSGDPRVKAAKTTVAGQDGTRIFTSLMYPLPTSPVPLATGTEARLIEAEALLAAGDDTGWLNGLNALRAAFTGAPALAPLADPGNKDARVNLMFRERAFWLYMTAHRVGDLRRLSRQYGRTAATIWPTGAYFKGGVYGTDVALKPSQAEQNNGAWKACTDRNP